MNPKKFPTLALVALAALAAGCHPAPPPARFEFHPHPSAEAIAIWRCDRLTGRVDLGVVETNGQASRWVTLPAAE